VEQWKKPFAKKNPKRGEAGIGISPECLAWRGWLIFPDRQAPVESVGGWVMIEDQAAQVLLGLWGGGLEPMRNSFSISSQSKRRGRLHEFWVILI
jgi:hypothetical protein